MKSIIYSYIVIIKEFKEELSKLYNLKEDLNWEEISSFVPKQSLLEKTSYVFHGGGCRIEKNGIICDFDFSPTNKYQIKFDLWKLFDFIKTMNDFKNLNYSEDFLLNEINKLIEEGILVKLKVGNFVLDVYQIKNKYYNNPDQLNSRIR